MIRVFTALLLAACAPALAGCVPMMAASAAGMAARSAQGTPASNEALRPGARDACSSEAAKYGAVHIIDVEQRAVNKIIIWGTVDDGKERRSFQCNFGTRITGFTLRKINASR
ncbi:MAG: hypothetical protein QOD54_710 [Sphingomonadales bacterium]|jgi:hypothetical protein|nr:hypothetical protein [Sphingomonadales bacterium]